MIKNGYLSDLVHHCSEDYFSINDVGLKRSIDNVICEIRSGRLTRDDVEEALSKTDIPEWDRRYIVSMMP